MWPCVWVSGVDGDGGDCGRVCGLVVWMVMGESVAVCVG